MSSVQDDIQIERFMKKMHKEKNFSVLSLFRIKSYHYSSIPKPQIPLIQLS